MVFFSGTDTTEIYENSEHHNIYLSLIVNNDNDMVAKIAFRAVQKSLTLEFKDDKGTAIVQTTEDGSNYIFVHDCDIILPDAGPLSDYDKRIQAIKASKTTGGTSTERFHSVEKPERKKGLSGSNVENRMYSFIRDILTGVSNSKRTMVSILEDIDRTKDRIGEKLMEKEYDKMRHRAGTAYRMAYPEDASLKKFVERVKDSMIVLANYETSFPDVVADLKECFKLIYVHDYNDSESRTYGYGWH